MLDDEAPRPGPKLIQRALAATGESVRLVLEAGHKKLGGGAATYANSLRDRHPDATTDELVDRVIRAHLMLARSQGAAAGLALSTAEVTTIVGSAGTLTVPTVVVVNATDLGSLLWIQLRMVLILAALHGHDPADPTRLREFLILQGATGAAADSVTTPLVKGTSRVGRRLIGRYLRGPVLANLKALFSAAGIRFSRAALLRQLPYLNIPINTVVNDAATRRLSRKARNYYETLPPGAGGSSSA